MSSNSRRSQSRKDPTAGIEAFHDELTEIRSGGDGYGDACESVWQILGTLIQVGRETAEDEADGRAGPESWSARDFEVTIEHVYDDIRLALSTLDAQDCASGADTWKMKNALPDHPQAMYRPIDAYGILTNVEQVYADVAPDYLDIGEEMVGVPDSYNTTSGGEGSGMEYDMRCAVGGSLRDVQREMVEHFADGVPESLTVDWNDDRKEYYACAIVSDIAEDY